MKAGKYNWDDLEIGQEVLVDGIEYDLILKTLDETLYLQGVYTNERIIGELKEDGRITFKLNTKQVPMERGKPLTPEMLTYMVWDDEQLEKATKGLRKAFDVLTAKTMWTDTMKCGHRVKKYETLIDGEDNVVRIRFRCVVGCLTEWFEFGRMPLPHTHDLSVIKMERTPELR